MTVPIRNRQEQLFGLDFQVTKPRGLWNARLLRLLRVDEAAFADLYARAERVASERMRERIDPPALPVVLSEQDADSFAPESWALRTERAVRESGRSWTMLRPSWFMQVFTDARYYRDQVGTGELPFPSGGATVAWIDARDIAAVAERALLEERHAERIYELSGPEALTLPRTAQVLSSALGRPVTHLELTIEEAVADIDGFDRQAFTTTFERLHAGVYSEVTDAVEQVTGRPAGTLQTFMAESGQIATST